MATLIAPPARTAAGDQQVRHGGLTAGRARDVAAAVFSTWVVAGLFVDGWAHNAGKPETFWTPWHALLYSGFVAAMVWFGVSDLRDRRHGTYVAADRLVLAGYGLFAAGGVADMAWHSVFGVEEDLEALLSPSHLLLMIAGLLLVTAPVRSALGDSGLGPSPAWRPFAPAAAGIALAVAVVSFFTQFTSVLHVTDLADDVFAAGAADELQIVGVVGVLVPTTLLIGALVWTTARWPRPPAGTFTLVFGGTALLMSGLDAFDGLVFAVPVLAAGALADALVARRVPVRLTATAVPAVMWSAWFAVYHADRGIGWPAELIGGTVVLAALTGFGLALLLAPGRSEPAVGRSTGAVSGPATRPRPAPAADAP